MKHPVCWAIFAAATLALLSSCAEEEDQPPIDALVIVQETNLGACAEPFSYERSVTRRCDARVISVRICAETPLCEAQLDALTAPLGRCEEERSQFRSSTEVRCQQVPAGGY